MRMIQLLEDRRLFAVTAVVTDGVLTIAGDDAANYVDVRLSGEDTLVVRSATAVEETEEETEGEGTTTLGCGGRHGRVGIDFGEVTTAEFDISEAGVESLLLSLGGGDDRTSHSRGVELPAPSESGGESRRGVGRT